MRKTLMRLSAVTLACAALSACVTPSAEEPVRVLRSDANGVVLRGLIDATRTTPPARYDALAQIECARTGQNATFVSMTQKSTFGFDVSYDCSAPG